MTVSKTAWHQRPLFTFSFISRFHRCYYCQKCALEETVVALAGFDSNKSIRHKSAEFKALKLQRDESCANAPGNRNCYVHRYACYWILLISKALRFVLLLLTNIWMNMQASSALERFQRENDGETHSEVYSPHRTICLCQVKRHQKCHIRSAEWLQTRLSSDDM